MTPEELSWFVDDVVAPAPERRRRRRVDRVGGVDREIRVALDPTACCRSASPPPTSTASFALTSVDLAGGRGEIGGREQSIRTLGSAQTRETRRDSIALPGGRRVRLDDVAT